LAGLSPAALERYQMKAPHAENAKDGMAPLKNTPEVDAVGDLSSPLF